VKRFPLAGTVVNAVTGEPIRKALVQVYEVQQHTAFTDDSGHFQFEAIPAGSYMVSAQKPGYLNDQELQRSPLMVEVAPAANSAVLKLTPEAILTGKITTATGVPMEHMTLNLTYLDVREGRRRWDNRGSTMTDEDGRYRFANLRPGGYYLAASPHTLPPENLLEAEKPATTGYPGLYYPGVPDLLSASPIDLSAGQQSEANLTLNEVPVYRVSGTVSGYSPNHGVSLQVFDPSGVMVPVGYQFSEANGRFDLQPLPAGSYVIKAFSASDPNQPMRAELRISLAADLHNLHLLLTPTSAIPIVVEMDGHARQTKPDVGGLRGAGNGPPVSVRLVGSGPGSAEFYASFENPNNPQTLSLRNWEPGRYTVVIDPRDSWYVASAEYGQTNLLTDDIVLTAGAPPSPLNIALRNDGASVEGRINAPDGWTAPVTVVAVLERSAKAAPFVRAYNGPFGGDAQQVGTLFDALAPGDYLIFAFDRMDGLEYSNRDVLENYTSQAVHLTLSPNQRAKVTLEIIHTAEVSH
jgi:hypothetical protein